MTHSLKDYQCHIMHPNAVDHPDESICGVTGIKNQWHFVDIDHAFLSAPKDRVQPCPNCAAIIIAVFMACE